MPIRFTKVTMTAMAKVCRKEKSDPQRTNAPLTWMQVLGAVPGGIHTNNKGIEDSLEWQKVEKQASCGRSSGTRNLHSQLGDQETTSTTMSMEPSLSTDDNDVAAMIVGTAPAKSKTTKKKRSVSAINKIEGERAGIRWIIVFDTPAGHASKRMRLVKAIESYEDWEEERARKQARIEQREKLRKKELARIPVEQQKGEKAMTALPKGSNHKEIIRKVPSFERKPREKGRKKGNTKLKEFLPSAYTDADNSLSSDEEEERKENQSVVISDDASIDIMSGFVSTSLVSSHEAALLRRSSAEPEEDEQEEDMFEQSMSLSDLYNTEEAPTAPVTPAITRTDNTGKRRKARKISGRSPQQAEESPSTTDEGDKSSSMVQGSESFMILSKAKAPIRPQPMLQPTPASMRRSQRFTMQGAKPKIARSFSSDGVTKSTPPLRGLRRELSGDNLGALIGDSNIMSARKGRRPSLTKTKLTIDEVPELASRFADSFGLQSSFNNNGSFSTEGSLESPLQKSSDHFVQFDPDASQLIQKVSKLVKAAAVSPSPGDGASVDSGNSDGDFSGGELSIDESFAGEAPASARAKGLRYPPPPPPTSRTPPMRRTNGRTPPRPQRKKVSLTTPIPKRRLIGRKSGF